MRGRVFRAGCKSPVAMEKEPRPPDAADRQAAPVPARALLSGQMDAAAIAAFIGSGCAHLRTGLRHVAAGEVAYFARALCGIGQDSAPCFSSHCWW